MEKKETTSSTPLGVCEKLFNAFHINPTFRPFHRLTYRPQDPAAAVPPRTVTPPPSPAALASGRKGPSPLPKPPTLDQSRPAPEKRAPVAIPFKVEPHHAAAPPQPLNDKAPAAAASSTPEKGQLSKVSTKAEAAAGTPEKDQLSKVPTKAAAAATPLPISAPERVPTRVGTAPPPPPPVENGNAASQRPPTARTTDRIETAKKNLNERADDYINRTRNKMRTGSNGGVVGRPPSSKGW